MARVTKRSSLTYKSKLRAALKKFHGKMNKAHAIAKRMRAPQFPDVGDYRVNDVFLSKQDAAESDSGIFKGYYSKHSDGNWYRHGIKNPPDWLIRGKLISSPRSIEYLNKLVAPNPM